MIHPSDLLRSNSENENQVFSAPVNMAKESFDCGFSALPNLNKCLKLDKYAKPGVFVIVLSIVGFLHGTLLNYFRGTSQIWSKHYSIPQETVDWLIYTNDVFISLFALTVAYWGNRIHRANWIGGLTIFLAVASIILAVPEVYKPVFDEEANITDIAGPILCNVNSKKISNHGIDSSNYVELAILVVYQIIFAMASCSFISHGIAYIDDNISPRHSPSFIACGLAANEIGKQAGIYLSWAPYIIDIKNIFLSPAWLTLAVLVLLSGTAITMFPRVLPNLIMKKGVASLIDIASGNSVDVETESIDGFWKSLGRLLRNKVLLINILAAVLLQSALINFNIFEKIFNETKYHIPKADTSGYSDPSLIQFTSNLLKQPLVAISTVTTGLVLAKTRPRIKYLIIWNIAVVILATLIFSSTKFLTCTDGFDNEHESKLINPKCSSSCGCLSQDKSFHPVCLEGKTYFSPCFAGCPSAKDIDNTGLKVYQDCRCSLKNTYANEGSCDSAKCNFFLALSQVNSIVSYGLIATTTMTNVLINIRCIAATDKALALGLQGTFLSLIPYVPVRIAYEFIVAQFCQYSENKKCLFYGESLTLFLPLSTIVLMCLSIIFTIVLLFIAQDIDLYSITKKSKSPSSPMLEMDNYCESPNSDEIDAAITDLEERTNFLAKNLHGRRDKFVSDNALDTLRSSKEDRINNYLSEGNLVPMLPGKLQVEGKTVSGNSGVSTDESLRVLMENVGDDHDSFGELKQLTTETDF